MSPRSILSFNKNAVKPVSLKPRRIAWLIGAAPLKNGRTDAWILNAAVFARERIFSDNFL